METDSSDLLFEGVPAETLHRLRDRAADDFGNPLVARPAVGGEPLRCCLRLAAPGDSIALIAFQPSTRGGPYAEIGPVFIHRVDCGGGVPQRCFPADFRDRRAVLRPYDAGGLMLDGVVAPPGESEELLRQLLSDEAVAFVQVRNVVAGCWNFTAFLEAARGSDAQVAAQ
jgi:hypothetical protein